MTHQVDNTEHKLCDEMWSLCPLTRVGHEHAIDVFYTGTIAREGTQALIGFRGSGTIKLSITMKHAAIQAFTLSTSSSGVNTMAKGVGSSQADTTWRVRWQQRLGVRVRQNR